MIRSLYLNLLKKTLLNWQYGEQEEQCIARFGNYRLKKAAPMDPFARHHGGDWPPTAHTMIGLQRLNNLQFCIEKVLSENVPGDLIETGVWRGGASIFMRAVLKAHGVTNRRVFVADSFQGLPKPDAKKYPKDAGDIHHTFNNYLGISLEEVRKNFRNYDLLDNQVIFLEGWFKDTLPSAPIKNLAVMRLDGDMYESTMDALTNLYPKLSPGGFCIIDDFCLKACFDSVTDYRVDHNISDPIYQIDGSGVFWIKGGIK